MKYIFEKFRYSKPSLFRLVSITIHLVLHNAPDCIQRIKKTNCFNSNFSEIKSF